MHKVQRVPETEAKGRIHSSTAIVIVMPDVPRDFQLDMKEVRIDTYRAQGAGGQHINKTDSACRAVHIPTGIMAQCQDSRDQTSNKAKAIENLRERLYTAFHADAFAADQAKRKE